MNSENFKQCSKLIPSSYVRQGENARKGHEHKIKTLLEHVSICIYVPNKIVLIVLYGLTTVVVYKMFFVLGTKVYSCVVWVNPVNVDHGLMCFSVYQLAIILPGYLGPARLDLYNMYACL